MTNEIVLYQPNEQFQLEVQLKNETVWLTQEQIAMLFGTQRPAITKHLNNIYNSGELARESTCSKMEYMPQYTVLTMTVLSGTPINRSAGSNSIKKWGHTEIRNKYMKDQID